MGVRGDAVGLEVLARHKQVGRRAAAASHPDADWQLLAGLAGDRSRSVRRVVAARTDAAPDTLRLLAADPDRAVREAVAANTGAPDDLLIRLLEDSHWSVRWTVVTNPAAGETVQQAMCEAADQDVRFILAQQPHLPMDIVFKLAHDPARQVRGVLAELTDNLAALQTLLEDGDAQVRAQAGMNRATTDIQRRRLVHDPSRTVRNAVVHAKAIHGWDVPEEDLLLLARDRSVNVRFWLATLPGATLPVYEILAEDPDEMVAANARRWLLPADDPRFPGKTARDILTGLTTQGHFANPRQLGQPIPHAIPEIVEELASRLQQSIDPSGRRPDYRLPERPTPPSA